jgi:hypothetical protein
MNFNELNWLVFRIFQKYGLSKCINSTAYFLHGSNINMFLQHLTINCSLYCLILRNPNSNAPTHLSWSLSSCCMYNNFT